MSIKRKKYNNMLILLIVGLGFLLLATGKLTQNNNSFPLLPQEATLQSLVFAKLVIERDNNQWQSNPEAPTEHIQQLVMAWRNAQMVPIAPPSPLPPKPIIVDVYLDDGSYPQTALLYPHIAAIKIHGQDQWWRLVNQEMETLLP
ncbi:hypothetical protein [Ferrimonas lipolytica]|uniref:Uncharacterized protein n=1 Tax=Ferrimonas lipolytica TaxID=2724191 RepID=A0A6H1UJF1_9GAMM|nr:hypothetical protein [Ferrimonas lipolytica]QIZ78346.1 hypothetical protein HER31_16430 [Ferrimonas lipolytica]